MDKNNLFSSARDQSKQKIKKPSQNKRRTERRRMAHEEQRRNPNIQIPMPPSRKRNKNKKKLSKTPVTDNNNLVPHPMEKKSIGSFNETVPTEQLPDDEHSFTTDKALKYLPFPTKSPIKEIEETSDVDSDILDIRTSSIRIFKKEGTEIFYPDALTPDKHQLPLPLKKEIQKDVSITKNVRRMLFEN